MEASNNLQNSQNDIQFADLDVDNYFNKHLRKKFNVNFLPTILLFKNNDINDRIKFRYDIGEENKVNLIQWINENTN
jgi:hypothetical protein